jgi:hypothetical protein
MAFQRVLGRCMSDGDDGRDITPIVTVLTVKSRPVTMTNSSVPRLHHCNPLHCPFQDWAGRFIFALCSNCPSRRLFPDVSRLFEITYCPRRNLGSAGANLSHVATCIIAYHNFSLPVQDHPTYAFPPFPQTLMHQDIVQTRYC